MRLIAIFAALALTPASASADERAVQLKQAPGLNVVEGQCGGCHSLDYVIMNSPFLDAAHWDAEVAKMIKAFGAPIDPADAKTIEDEIGIASGHVLPPQSHHSHTSTQATLTSLVAGVDRADRRANHEIRLHSGG